MACNECYGTYPNCPVCSETPDMEVEPCTCLDGWIYTNEDGEVLTLEEWEKLPEDDRVKDNCPTCNAARKVNGYLINKNKTLYK